MSDSGVLISNLAQLEKNGETLDDSLDILWSLFGAFMVFFMQTGFAMLEAGTVRKQNTINILLKNMIDSCIAALIWWAIGYPLAFESNGEGIRKFIGGSNFFLANVKTSEDVKYYSRWIFQFAFAATSATIVSGAAAERCRYQAYALYTIIITGFIYPVVVHWVWSDWGWLSAHNEDRTFDGSLGLIDFAGSSVVHVTGGGAAFFAAWCLGPRTGRFDQNGNSNSFKSSNPSLILLGSFILWFGWYSFNAVSTLCVRGCMATASLAAVNTTLSAASGGITVLLTNLLQGNPIQIAPGLNGLLAGLVGITAGCTVVEPYAAVLIGTLSGFVYYNATKLLIKIKVDDPLEATCVHFFPGFLGTIAVGLFATETNLHRAYSDTFVIDKTDYGLLYGGDGRQLCIQILGAIVIACWTCTINFALFGFMRSKNWLRVRQSQELHGLNASIHGEPEKRGFNGMAGSIEMIGADRNRHILDNTQHEDPASPSSLQ